MSRWGIPLCGGRCIKFGLSLGSTIPDSDFVHLDLTRAKFGGTQRAMGLMRHGDPSHVFIDDAAPISADMFKVADAVIQWYDGPDWRELVVEANPSRKRVQGIISASDVLNGVGRNSVHDRYPNKLQRRR